MSVIMVIMVRTESCCDVQIECSLLYTICFDLPLPEWYLSFNSSLLNHFTKIIFQYVFYTTKYVYTESSFYFVFKLPFPLGLYLHFLILEETVFQLRE